jgi:hypothetical protein
MGIGLGHSEMRLGESAGSRLRRNSAKIRITPNTLIVIAAIVSLIVVLVSLEVHIRHSLGRSSRMDQCASCSVEPDERAAGLYGRQLGSLRVLVHGGSARG